MLEYQPFPGKEAQHIFAFLFFCATNLRKYEYTHLLKVLQPEVRFSLLLLTFCNQSDIRLVIICDVLKTFRSCNKLKIFK